MYTYKNVHTHTHTHTRMKTSLWAATRRWRAQRHYHCTAVSDIHENDIDLLSECLVHAAWWAQRHSDACHCHSDACHCLGTASFTIALQPNMMTHNKTESETHSKTRIRYAYIYPHKNTTDFHGQLLVDGGRRDVYHHLLWLQHRQASWLEGACVYVCVRGRRKCVYMCVWRDGVRVCNVRV